MDAASLQITLLRIILSEHFVNDFNLGKKNNMSLYIFIVDIQYIFILL
jgi:hypothetical protein